MDLDDETREMLGGDIPWESKLPRWITSKQLSNARAESHLRAVKRYNKANALNIRNARKLRYWSDPVYRAKVIATVAAHNKKNRVKINARRRLAGT